MKIKNAPKAEAAVCEKVALPPGRPRAFDTTEALDKALDLFWRKGYEGTSLSDLTEAIGVNRPSLYAAFGNKEALFQKALDRYAEMNSSFMNQAMKKPTAFATVKHLLMAAADAQSGDHPAGCLLVKGALACSEASSSIQQELNRRRACGETQLCLRFERAKIEGDLPAKTNCADLARYVSTVLQGLSVQAVGGASREELRRVVALALKGWPV